jgi:hypothetical protein
LIGRQHAIGLRQGVEIAGLDTRHPRRSFGILNALLE